MLTVVYNGRKYQNEDGFWIGYPMEGERWPNCPIRVTDPQTRERLDKLAAEPVNEN